MLAWFDAESTKKAMCFECLARLYDPATDDDGSGERRSDMRLSIQCGTCLAWLCNKCAGRDENDEGRTRLSFACPTRACAAKF